VASARRLNALVSLLGKDVGRLVCAEMEGAHAPHGAGDVKYHLPSQGDALAMDAEARLRCARDATRKDRRPASNLLLDR
jgi:2-oxoglutarate dehydrogenase complex dehydrogenase (E1) component-like enzyme